MTGNERPLTAISGARAASPLSQAMGRRPVLTAGLGAACISSSAVLVTLAHVGPATTAVFRCALALPVLILLAAIEQRRLGPRPAATRLYAMLAGLQVLFVGVVAWLVLKERPDRRYLIVLPVVLAGVILVSGMFGGHAAGLDPVAGVVFGLGTSAAYACFLLILRGTSGTTPHVAGQLADATAGAALGSLVLGLLFGGLQLDIPWPSFGWLLLLAMLSQTAGWLLITSSLPRLPAAVSSLLLLLQPAAAMVLADVVLGERPTLTQIGGAVLVCLGVLAVARTGPQRPAFPDERTAPDPAPAARTRAPAQACTENST